MASKSQPEREEKLRFGSLNASIGERIRLMRKAESLTTRDIEQQTGVPNNTISKLENGKQNITPRYLELFAGVFECEPRDLLPTDPARAQLDAAVNARDPRAVLDALAELGIHLPAGDVLNPTAPQAPDSGEEVVDAMVAAQLRASAEMLEKRTGYVIYSSSYNVEERELRASDLLSLLGPVVAGGPVATFVDALVAQVKRQFDGLTKRFESSTKLLQAVALGGLILPKTGLGAREILQPAQLQDLLRENPELVEELGAALRDVSERDEDGEGTAG